MLVKIIEISESGGPVASIVRLIPLNYCYMSAADAFEVSVSPSIKCLSTAFNRKLSSSRLSIGVEDGKSIDEIIESAAEVITKLSDEHGDFSGKPDCRRFPYSGPDGEMPDFRVVIGKQSILIFAGDSREPVPQISKVFFCPTYTKEAAIKAVMGCDTLHECSPKIDTATRKPSGV